MAASSSRISEDEKIFAELVNYVDREIPIICLYNEEDVDLSISVSSSRSVPVNIVINSIEDTKDTVNNLIEDTVNNASEDTVNNSIEDPTDKTAKTLTTTSNCISNSTQAAATSTQDLNDNWGRSLACLPAFGTKEIEEHRKNSGKTPDTAIIKTLDRGRKFFEERYISSNSVYCKEDEGDRLLFKASCKASMQKSMRDVNVELDKSSSKVIRGKCSCPAGKSGYCNHVMALLFEIADYSLKGHKMIPHEVACTSRTRQWGIPGKSIQAPKAPIMATTIQKLPSKRGISSTLFEPRKEQHVLDTNDAIETFKKRLEKIDSRMGFVCAIPPKEAWTEVRETPHGNFIVGSPLACHLHPIGFDRTVTTNIATLENPGVCSKKAENVDLPNNFISRESKCIPSFSISEKERKYLESQAKTETEVRELERQTIKQATCELWHSARKNKLTSSTSHKVFIRQRNFENLLAEFTKPKTNLPKSVRDNFEHGKNYEPIARQVYQNVLNYKLNRNCTVRETGCVIQPNLPWLLASPDGLVVDPDGIGLIEIKCPKSKANHTLKEMLGDKSFYVGENDDGTLYLKEKHSYGYFTQIQMAMGLSGISFCDFVVFTFTTIIIIRIPFDKEYFTQLVSKLNNFYEKYLLKSIMKNI